MSLTDERHLLLLEKRYPGARPIKATKGPDIAERTATEIWSILMQLEQPPMLWNVFPFHPHILGKEMTNRRFLARELAVVSDLNQALISWLGIKHIVCIGQDAASYAPSFGIDFEYVRHPSYGGIREFREGMHRIYKYNCGKT
ncbi:uracil-DNA glycosylase [Chromobacterium haemolyticum]|nr:uracil-DNA glycosylase [Chromobacterium haemolyticum]